MYLMYVCIYIIIIISDINKTLLIDTNNNNKINLYDDNIMLYMKLI